jgi:SAM-dependent methyltransferase
VKSELVARQSRRPSGWLGEIVARVMALETAPANRIALEQLAVQDGEAILEVGCGHGSTLARIARGPFGSLAGVDASEVMVRLASKRLRPSIAAGRAEVSLATSDALPFASGRFDAAFAVHVLYFWSDPRADLRELGRVLKPGGRILLGYRPRDEQTRAALPASVYSLRSQQEVEGLLAGAGFVAIRSALRSLGGSPFVLSEARRPPSLVTDPCRSPSGLPDSP